MTTVIPAEVRLAWGQYVAAYNEHVAFDGGNHKIDNEYSRARGATWKAFVREIKNFYGEGQAAISAIQGDICTITFKNGGGFELSYKDPL